MGLLYIINTNRGGFGMNTKRMGAALVLAMVLTAGLLYAGGGGEPEEPRTITFVADNLIGEAMGLDAVIERFKELTGVDLKVIIPPHQQYEEKLQVMAASGDLPDVWQVYPALSLAFAREGVNIPLDEYIKKSKNIKRIDEGHFAPFIVKGKIYGIPFNGGGGTVTYIRKDWLDNLGMAMPTSLDELIEVAKAFTFEDPDGNGKDDTIGYTSKASGNNLDVYYFATMFQGAFPDFTQKDGKWVDGFSQPEMKEAIERIRKGYNEGWVDPEIFTNQTSTIRDKYTNGVAGIFTYWSGAWGVVLQQRVEASSGPQADVVALPSLGKANYWNRPSVPQSITVKAEDPKFVFDTLLDRMWDQGDMEFLFIHGVEGVHWTKEDGTYTKLPGRDNPELMFSKAYIHPELTLLPLKDGDPFTYDPKLFASEKARQQNMKQFYIPSGGDVYAKDIGDLQALRLEVFSKIIAGDLSLDEGYKHYDEMTKRLQIDAMIKELEES
jgi:putative aldouronate transport system substrate-binding protein